MTSPVQKSSVDAVRRFNRWYTTRIGLLEEGLLHSPLSLPEARVVYEVANRKRATAGELATDLRLDPGYVSRLVGKLERRGMLDRRPAPDDRRRRLLRLTRSGRSQFAKLNAASHAEIGAMLDDLGDDERAAVLASMATIEDLLDGPDEERVPYILRPPQPGDLGWVVQRHGALYRNEYGWDETFEGLVASVVSDFVRDFDARRECCWIAERHGVPVGSVFLVKHAEREGVARLRLLIVEPRARGLGIGRRLVQECTRFARQCGYARITLWTNSILLAARRLYVAEGYEMVRSEKHTDFGHGLIGETWELEL